MPLRCKKGPYFPYIKISIYYKYITGLFGYFLHLSIHLYYITLQSSCQSIPSIINKMFTITIFPISVLSSYLITSFLLNILPFPFPFKNKLSTRRSRFLHLRTAGSINEKQFDGDPNEVRGRGEKTESLFGQRRGCGETWFPKYI